ncbi:hypothetical protein [Limnohabitans sp.]|jgi:hypothetical protein|uniref:hypothetical protein n=1 Tax=Limnohabitans sp. TaxID=1907725 RepID=UPI0037C11313
MNFKPIDEMSLRHLFSSEYGKSILGMSYIGPVLDQIGKIDPSPDALVLDMRKSPYQVKRCEFKFCPSNLTEFSHNGKFDIAIMWSISSPLTKESLLKSLLEQNGCNELIVMDEIGDFHSLPNYDLEKITRKFSLESVKNSLLKVKSGLPSIYVLYVASKIYPKRFDSDKILDLLLKKFPSVSAMKPQGRGNVVSAFLQTTPPLIRKMYGKSYEWNIDFDPITSNALLAEIIRLHFRGELPNDFEVQSVIDGGF